MGYDNSQGGNNQPYGIAAIGAGIGDLFNKNPANGAQHYLNQIPGMLNGVYQPWMQGGQQAVAPYTQGGQWAGGQLQGQLNNLMNNPTGMFNQWGSTYHSSPGFNWNVGQATNAANNAAAAGGMAGSPEEQQSLASTVNGLANQDYWQYINNAQNLYGQGLEGTQNMYNQGAQTANNMYGVGGQMADQYGSNLASNAINQGIFSYNGQMNQNQSFGGGIGSILTGLYGNKGTGGVGGFLSDLGL